MPKIHADVRRSIAERLRGPIRERIAAGLVPSRRWLRDAYPDVGVDLALSVRDELRAAGEVPPWAAGRRGRRSFASDVHGAAPQPCSNAAQAEVIRERARRLREGRDLDTGEVVGLAPAPAPGRPLDVEGQLRRLTVHRDPGPIEGRATR
jgi:hypothetical protein